MKKSKLLLCTLSLTAALLVGCKEEPATVINLDPVSETPSESVSESEATPEPIPEGMYRSELTNEFISLDIKDQRPIAVMVDNEKTALDHYGVNNADIVYELMNSTMNGRVTRLMVVYKDWQNIKQLGSVRSARPTNFLLAAEYNAILCHDGGPFYIDAYVAKNYTNNLSGGFARYSNGKAAEFTEYITYDEYTNTSKGKTYDGLGKRIDDRKYSRTYNEFYEGKHFAFSDTEFTLDDRTDAKKAENVELPFPHNESKLFYNKETKLYEYNEYGAPHIDALDGKVTAFKNVILIECDHYQYDDHGYMIYDTITSGKTGYYLTNGEAIPITWSKEYENAIMHFTDLKTNQDVVLNTGKTYIAFVPMDSWDELVLN